MVKPGQGKDIAEEYSVEFFEISCKSGSNVDKCFTSIASSVIDVMKAQPMKPALPPSEEPKPTLTSKDKKGDCIIS
jgi:hypothetical protein